MADAVLAALEPVLTRWTMGGTAAQTAPAAWRATLGPDAGEAELRLLALSGQLLGALTIAEPVGDVQARADIPPLPYPTIPDPLRPRARRLLQPSARRDLLDFLAARGWTVHPGDWMPRPGEDVPDVYAAWQDWAAATGSPSSAIDSLTAESWNRFGPATRHAAFRALRRRDPAQARTLLDAKIEGEPADRRVRLLEAMAEGLSDADRPMLERLAGDRAPRVKALAASLMARLGRDQGGGEDAAELAGVFAVQIRGLLRRTRVIVPRPLKTAAQQNRRATLLQTLSLDAFAQALDLPAPDLASAWTWGTDAAADYPFAAMIARSGSDDIVAATVDTLTTGPVIDPMALAPLLPRLMPALRRRAAVRLLHAHDASFAMVRTIAGGDGGIDDMIDTPAGMAMLAALKTNDARSGDQAEELLALGLIASRGAARQALDHIATAGVIASDPRLDMLRLNAALDERRPTE